MNLPNPPRAANLADSEGACKIIPFGRESLNGAGDCPCPVDEQNIRSVWATVRLLGKGGWFSIKRNVLWRLFEIFDAEFGGQHPTARACLDELVTFALLQEHMGERGESEKIYRDVLKAYARILCSDHQDTLEVMTYLGIFLSKLGKFDDAEVVQRRRLDVWERTQGRQRRNGVEHLEFLADTLFAKNDFAGAEELYRRKLAELDCKPENVPIVPPIDLHHLARCLDKNGKWEEATQIYRRLLAHEETVSGPEHPDTIHLLVSLAKCLDAMADFTGAEVLYRRLVEAERNRFATLLASMDPPPANFRISSYNTARFRRDEAYRLLASCLDAKKAIRECVPLLSEPKPTQIPDCPSQHER